MKRLHQRLAPLWFAAAIWAGLAQAAPTVTLTAPAPESTHAEPASIGIEATASAERGRRIRRVSFYRDGILVGHDSKAPYGVTWRKARPGTYQLTAVAVDNRGERAVSAPVPVTVTAEGAGLSVTLTSPAPDASYTSPATIDIDAAVTVDPNRKVRKVSFYRDGILIGNDTKAPYSVTWSGVPPGTYSLTAEVTDSKKGVATSAPVSVTVAAQNAAPSVSLSTPGNGSSYLAPATVVLSAHATDSDGSIAQVEFFAGTTLIGTATAAPYTVSWDGVVAGSYSLTAKATDDQGATTTSSAVAITVAANQPPAVSLTSPSAGAAFVSPAEIMLTASASDADGTVVKVDFYQGTTLIGTATAAPYGLTWNDAPAGSYMLTAKATDDHGAVTTSAAVPVTVADNQLPAVTLTSPTAGASFISPAQITLTASASDVDGVVSKVEFYNGSTLIGTATTAPYTVSWNDVGPGAYSLTAKVTDDRGAEAVSAVIGITVAENQIPTVSLTSPSAGTSYISPATMILTATAADADGTVTLVEFYQGTTLIGTATAAPYSMTWSNVAAGEYTLSAKATDDRGAVATSAVTAVAVLDNQLPAVTLTSPTAGDSFVSPADIILTAAASDADGSIAMVEFFEGTTLIGSATAEPYSVTWTSVGAGSYSLTARVTDDRGGQTTSAPTTVSVVDNQSPTVTLTSPLDGASFVSPAEITLSATASDADGAVAKVEFFDGATLIGTATSAPYIVTWTEVPSGTYSLSAVVTDDRGAQTASAVTSITVADNAFPLVSLTGPANGQSYIAPAEVVLTASASDADGTVEKVEFFEGTTLIGTATSAPYSVTWADVVAGSYSLTARATDDRGAQTSSSARTISVVDNQAPMVSLTSPLAGASYVSPAEIMLTATASDTDGTVAKVEFFEGTTLIGMATAAPYSVTWSNVPAGAYSLTAVATDERGAQTSTEALAIAVVDNQLPTVTLTSPSAGAAFIAPASVTLMASADDGDGAVAKVEFFNGSTLIGSAATAPYTVTWDNVGVGTYSLTAKVTDDRGAEATSAATTITVGENQPPSVSLTSPVEGQSFLAPAELVLTASASDADGTVAKVDFYEGATLIGTATSAPYSVAWSNVAAGSYSLAAKAVDDRGAEVMSAPVAISVADNALPTVTLTTPSDGQVFVAPAAIMLSAAATDSDGTVAKVEFFEGATLIGTAANAPYTMTWGGVGAGSYSFTAQVTDDRGAVVTSAAVVVTVIDNQPPVVALTSPSATDSFTAPATILLAAEASDPDGSIAKVEFFHGSTLVATATAAPYTATWSDVAAGSYSLTAIVTDDVGSQTVSAPVTITVTGGAPTVLYLHGDHLGTPRVATDAANRIVWRNVPTGESFGMSPPEEDPDGDGQVTVLNLRFPGQYFDRETLLNYNYFRDYDAATGRYVQSDPIGLVGGINTYAYVNGNPIAYADPTGEHPVVIAALGIGVAAAAGSTYGFKVCMSRCGCEKLDSIDQCDGRCPPKRYSECANSCLQFVNLWAFIGDPVRSTSSQLGQEIGKK